MIKCIIVDDDPMSRKSLEILCGKISDLDLVATYESPLEAMSEIDNAEIDLIFMDVMMPEISGIEVIKSMQVAPEVVLVTSSKEYALEAFEHNVTDYLLKPITLPRLLKTVDRIKSRRESHIEKPVNSDEIYVKVKSRLVKLKYDEILWIESKGDYALFKTTDKSHIVHATLKKLEEKLPTDIFFKVHRSYIVNMSKIIDIEDNSILIQEKVIPVSRSQREGLMNRLNLI